jgi:predicted flap endonuclease-1-like 5' DNA nuclease
VHLSDTADRPDNAEIERLRAELAGANGEIERLRAELATPRTIAAHRERDPLIDINGIGPAYEQRLFDAGIYTFDDLAAQTPARLRELVGAKAWQEADTEAWIAEARQMAQKHERTLAIGGPRHDPLIDINGIGPAYEQRLFDAGIYTFDDLAAQTPARLRELVGAKAWQEADTEAWIAEARQMAQAAKERSAQ